MKKRGGINKKHDKKVAVVIAAIVLLVILAGLFLYISSRGFFKKIKGEAGELGSYKEKTDGPVVSDTYEDDDIIEGKCEIDEDCNDWPGEICCADNSSIYYHICLRYQYMKIIGSDRDDSGTWYLKTCKYSYIWEEPEAEVRSTTCFCQSFPKGSISQLDPVTKANTKKFEWSCVLDAMDSFECPMSRKT